MNITNCSMGCLYAEYGVEKCHCKCRGTMHGLMVPKTEAAKCSPAVEYRCKSGHENGKCRCVCKGVNHGLYREIEGFENVRITGLAI